MAVAALAGPVRPPSLRRTWPSAFPGFSTNTDSDVMYDWDDRDGQEEWLPMEFVAADDDGD
jgi:hypothetical protein